MQFLLRKITNILRNNSTTTPAVLIILKKSFVSVHFLNGGVCSIRVRLADDSRLRHVITILRKKESSVEVDAHLTHRNVNPFGLRDQPA
jgi:hypothetical protein